MKDGPKDMVGERGDQGCRLAFKRAISAKFALVEEVCQKYIDFAIF